MNPAFIVAARRTAVAPRGGAFRAVEAHDLAVPVLRACLDDAGVAANPVDYVILGNALSGGGNVARLAALAAGLSEHVPALTIDTQCCSGLDAIQLATRMVESGAAQLVLAGGVESFSRADQAAFAIDSHARALAARARLAAEIVPVAGLSLDSFARALTPALCARAPVLHRDGETELDAAGVAVEADAAAIVLVASREWAERCRLAGRELCEVVHARSFAAAPDDPPGAIDHALAWAPRPEGARLYVVELMEASAGQAMRNARQGGFDPAAVNRGGGALARGHPIGASGAILAVRLFHELAREPRHARGLSAIGAAGGLASLLMLQRL